MGRSVSSSVGSWWMRVLLGVLLVTSLTSLVTTPVGAAVNTCGAAGNYYVGRGWNPAGAEPTGASARIMRPAAADLCTSANTTSSAWTMLANDAGTGWAQIGFVNLNWSSSNTPTHDKNEFFMQWRKNASSPAYTLYWGSPSVGSAWEFQATRWTSDGNIHLILDGANEWHTDFDPVDAWPGRSTQFFGETWRPGSDYFGTQGNRAEFRDVQSKTPSDGWANRNWTFGVSDFCYGHVHEVTNNSKFETWTSPLDHTC